MSLPDGELERRWRRLRAELAKEGAAGLLVFSNQVNQTYVHYVANYTLLGEAAFFYLPADGDPVLVISESWDLDRARRESGLEDVRVLRGPGVTDVVKLVKGDAARGAVAVAGMELLNQGWLGELQEACGKAVVSGTDLIETVALVKTEYELGLIRQAGAMADAAFLHCLEIVREGLSDHEIVAEIDYTMKKMGATDNFQMSAVGRDITGMLLPFYKKVEPGDMLLFEITPAHKSVTYSAQLCRTAAFGELPELFYEKYAMLARAQEESLKIVKPGVKVSEVARIQNEIISAAGYPEYCRPPYMRSRGHGFGLGRLEVAPETTAVFLENMSVVIHPNQFIPETGYLAIGEHIIVTKDGFERQTKTKPQIYTCGGGKA